MKVCAQCGSNNKDTSIFCVYCGHKLERQAQNKDCFPSSTVAPGSSQATGSRLLMTLEGMVLHKGKQPIGILKIYSDKVEFVHSGRNFATAALIGGVIGGMIAAQTAEESSSKDCFMMRDIAVANRSNHPKFSSYVEIVLRDGNKVKYLDRTGRHRAEYLFAAVDAINASLKRF